ncbi:NADH dehydrogenase [ubiquinone] 1 beta subcomplex subunit 4-like [Tubulanus polymorphus]|uniref:NADH dehydrogenase [ubiquinone] 1 beta subcomplex subunit 4-like n=1 Tax=Tubulanus polymorphus TaxID=672921 RepID=UPI003DA6962D
MASDGQKLSWDPRKLFNISSEEKRLINERAELRAERKLEWQKKLSNPYRGTTGYIFDPAVQRYFSTRSGGYEYFRATPYTAVLGLAFGLLPMVALYKLITKQRNQREMKIRNGEVAYKDRPFKFIN